MFGERERGLKVVEEKATTLLDEGCQFEGKLTFEGSVQINGRFRGEIFSDGTLIIGEGADVEGTVEIETVVIAGRFSGTIRAKRLIEMQPPAWVRAEIKTASLVVQEGAVFEGNCSMGKKSEPAPSRSKSARIKKKKRSRSSIFRQVIRRGSRLSDSARLRRAAHDGKAAVCCLHGQSPRSLPLTGAVRL